MLFYLILCFTIVPVVELAVLLKAGRIIGVLNTIAIVILTGIVGALLARSQGIMILQKIREDLEKGMMPGDKLIDGALILCGGILLLTPGFITDFAGFITLVPFTRHYVKRWIVKNFMSKYTHQTQAYIDINSE